MCWCLVGFGDSVVDCDLEVWWFIGWFCVFECFGMDVCLGWMMCIIGEYVYIGCIGFVVEDGMCFLIDWCILVVELYFGVMMEDLCGIILCCCYCWSGGCVSDYWDEVFILEVFDGVVFLDD